LGKEAAVGLIQIKNESLSKFIGLGVATAARAWMNTIDCRVACYDSSVDMTLPGWAGRAIFIFWHEYILFPLATYGRNRISMLLSQSRDADWLTEAAHTMGFDTVRGSSSKGAAAALRELKEKAQRGNLTITPDGPRGPRRVLAQGPIYLASRLQMPLVCLGFGYDRPWRLSTWDQFAVPRPGSRARLITSPQVFIPPDLDRDGIEDYRVRVETLLTDLTTTAEDWAQSGRSIEGERICRPVPMPIEVRHALERGDYSEERIEAEYPELVREAA